MADHQRSFIIYFVLFSSFACSTLHALQFVVGGRDGWVLNPFENYNHWAERMRFQVNDTLLFKYQKGSESVLVVNKDDYEKCNTGNPILKLQDGNSIIRFDRSGLFFFISGSKSNCANGQKLIIAVLAVRNDRSLSPPPPPQPMAPPPETESPAASNTSPSSPPAEAPTPASSGEGPSAVHGGHPPMVIDYLPPPHHHRSFATAASVSCSSVVLVSMISLGCISIMF